MNKITSYLLSVLIISFSVSAFEVSDPTFGDEKVVFCKVTDASLSLEAIDDPTFGEDGITVVCESHIDAAGDLDIQDPTFGDDRVIIIGDLQDLSKDVNDPTFDDVVIIFDTQGCVDLTGSKEQCSSVLKKLRSLGVGEVVAQPVE